MKKRERRENLWKMIGGWMMREINKKRERGKKDQKKGYGIYSGWY